MTPALLAAINALLEAIDHDENRSGGLLDRATLRKASELRQAVAREIAEQAETAGRST
jgi:hypothetical protein